MVAQATIEDFLSQKKMAVIGASRTGNKIGNSVLKELPAKGYTLFPVHPQMEYVGDAKCYPSATALPEPVDAAFIAVSPVKSINAVKDAHAAGITKLWIQQGAQSEESLQYCADNNIQVVSGECIFMHVEPVESIHKFHRFFRKLFGRMPR